MIKNVASSKPTFEKLKGYFHTKVFSFVFYLHLFPPVESEIYRDSSSGSRHDDAVSLCALLLHDSVLRFAFPKEWFFTLVDNESLGYAVNIQLVAAVRSVFYVACERNVLLVFFLRVRER